MSGPVDYNKITHVFVHPLGLLTAQKAEIEKLIDGIILLSASAKIYFHRDIFEILRLEQGRKNQSLSELLEKVCERHEERVLLNTKSGIPSSLQASGATADSTVVLVGYPSSEWLSLSRKELNINALNCLTVSADGRFVLTNNPLEVYAIPDRTSVSSQKVTQAGIRVYDDTGSPITLVEKIENGRSRGVFRTDGSNYLVKIFPVKHRANYQKEKILKLIRLKYYLQEKYLNDPVHRAFPTNLIYADDLQKEWIGYLMPIAEGRPLLQVIAPGIPGYETTFSGILSSVSKITLATICGNLCKAVAILHAENILLSDIKADNFFVTDTLDIIPIDLDGYSIAYSPCQLPIPQYRRDQDKKFKHPYFQDIDTELFSLASLIFHMLTGKNSLTECALPEEQKLEQYKANYLENNADQFFYKLWYSYPQCIRTRLIKTSTGYDAPTAAEWMRIFVEYIVALKAHIVPNTLRPDSFKKISNLKFPSRIVPLFSGIVRLKGMDDVLAHLTIDTQSLLQSASQSIQQTIEWSSPQLVMQPNKQPVQQPALQPLPQPESKPYVTSYVQTPASGGNLNTSWVGIAVACIFAIMFLGCILYFAIGNVRLAVVNELATSQTVATTASGLNDGNQENRSLNGYHVYHWENGDVYKGNWENGKRKGEGRYEWANGEVYEGGFVDGVLQGYGEYYSTNGEVYKGNWENGFRTGSGSSYVMNDGLLQLVYEGNWENSVFNGEGTYYFKDGASYAGTWDHGNLGPLELTIEGTDKTFSGEWRNNYYYGDQPN